LFNQTPCRVATFPAAIPQQASKGLD